MYRLTRGGLSDSPIPIVARRVALRPSGMSTPFAAIGMAHPAGRALNPVGFLNTQVTTTMPPPVRAPFAGVVVTPGGTVARSQQIMAPVDIGPSPVPMLAQSMTPITAAPAVPSSPGSSVAKPASAAGPSWVLPAVAALGLFFFLRR